MVQIDSFLTKIMGSPCYVTTEPKKLVLGRKSSNPSFISCKINSNNCALLTDAIRKGFYYIDSQLTFTLPDSVDLSCYKLLKDEWVRPPTKTEFDSILGMIPGLFHHSRFHADDNIPNTVADKIKIEWARNYFQESSKKIPFIIFKKGIPVGFLLIKLTDGKAVIDLIGIKKEFTNKGFGKKLIYFAKVKFQKDYIIQVGTQSINKKAIGLYNSCKFQLHEITHVLHFMGHFNT